jgi:HAD superfamily hydrolase (TIGR01549 family)
MSPVRQPPHAVLFDWDGTLVDSARASFLCYQRLFARYGIDFDLERFQTTYSPDWYVTYRAIGLPQSLWAEADTRWLELYEATPSELIAGAKEGLARLYDAGLRLGLVTSGDRLRISREIALLDVERFFSVLVCAQDAPRPKPAPDPVLRALGELDLASDRAAYVGDSPEDVVMARAAGVFSIGIPGGFPNQEALRLSKPDYLARDLAEAVAYLLDPS